MDQSRRAWSQEEDDTIRACVTQMGMRWRQIAPLLPGRSDDSVRNRWKRLKEEAEEDGADDADDDGTGGRPSKRSASDADGAPAAKRHASTAKPREASRTASKASADDDADGGEGGGRVSWSSHEDQVIVRAVQELGPRWCAVAARLPSRTDQAVRNRWNRLQQRARVQARTMLNAFHQGRNGMPPPVPGGAS